MKLKIVFAAIAALVLSVGMSTAASAHGGRYCRPHGHCYHRGHARVYAPVVYTSAPHVKVVYGGHRGYHNYNHGYRGRTHHHYSRSYGHHYGSGHHYRGR